MTNPEPRKSLRSAARDLREAWNTAAEKPAKTAADAPAPGTDTELDGARYREAEENTGESDNGVHTDADLLRGRLWARK